jgi:hypothetical protein
MPKRRGARLTCAKTYRRFEAGLDNSYKQVGGLSRLGWLEGFGPLKWRACGNARVGV